MQYLLILNWCFTIVTAWNLATYDDAGLNFVTNNNDYEIVHVSVFYVRAFLTIRNSRNSSKQDITIIESTWPENLLPIQSRIFPNDLSHSKSESNCNGIVKTVQTAVDRSNGLLWLLDNGSQYCTPKLIVFDLLRGNAEVHRFVFTKLRNSFKSIQLYVQEDIEGNGNAIVPLATTSVLILLHRSAFLIQYSLRQDRPRKLVLVISKKAKGYDVLIPAEITLKNDKELFISDHSNGLWLADLTKTKSNPNKGEDSFVEVKYLGSLLGASTALTIPTMIDGDSSHYLYYYLPRDGAVVRWNFRLPLRAEAHDVLHLHQKSIVQIIFGAKGSVWVVYENADEIGDHCRRILNFLALNGPRLIL